MNTMAQPHDYYSARRVAERNARQRKYANCQQEYQQVLWEQQHPAPERHTDSLHPISSTSYTSWYEYVDALTQHVRLKEAKEQAIRERAERMRKSHEQTQERISRVLGRIDPQLPESQTTTKALTVYGQHEFISTSPIESMSALLDRVIWLYIGRYGIPQTSIRMSNHNHLMFSLEYRNYTEDSIYSNQHGSFRIIPDSHLNDTTIISD